MKKIILSMILSISFVFNSFAMNITESDEKVNVEQLVDDFIVSCFDISIIDQRLKNIDESYIKKDILPELARILIDKTEINKKFSDLDVDLKTDLINIFCAVSIYMPIDDPDILNLIHYIRELLFGDFICAENELLFENTFALMNILMSSNGELIQALLDEEKTTIKKEYMYVLDRLNKSFSSEESALFIKNIATVLAKYLVTQLVNGFTISF